MNNQNSAITREKSGKATISLVLGIVSIVFSILTAIPAIIIGAKALKEIKRKDLDGKGEATAGLVLGIVFTAIPVICILIILGSIGVSYHISTQINKEKIREIGGKIHVPPPTPYATMELGEFTINIPGEDEEPHFIRVKVFIAYQERKLALQAELARRRIQIKDKITKIISRKTKKELDTLDGKSNLKVEIKKQINRLLQSGKIMDIYFENLTVM